MRESGIRGLLIYCSDYHCSHWIAIDGDRWPDDVRLSDLEPHFVCQACGNRGAAGLSGSKNGHRLVQGSAGLLALQFQNLALNQTKRNIRRRVSNPEPSKHLRESSTTSRWRTLMNIKTLGAAAVVTAALTVPSFAQHHVRGLSYHKQAYGYGPVHGTTFRSAYARLSVGEPFYDPFSRVGGMDPDMNPSGN
jgi:hypothetical protein